MEDLDRRFDPAKPDLKLLFRFAAGPSSSRPEVRKVLVGWIDRSVGVWSKDEQAVFSLPLAVDGAVRAAVVEALSRTFEGDAALRAEERGVRAAIAAHGPFRAPGAVDLVRLYEENLVTARAPDEGER